MERGALTPEAAAARLATLPFEDLGHARVDHHRSLRIGLPEVVFAAGKTAEQTVAIFASLAADGVDVLATRVEPATAQAILAAHPAAIHNAVARTVALRQSAGAGGAGASEAGAGETKGHVAVICAGTSDLPIAEEAAVTAETFGAQVTRLYDVGVAGLHRLLAVRDDLKSANAIIVCAGMEGALPSVVGGLVAVPVIAVPRRWATGVVRRRDRAAWNAELVQPQCHSGQHRQWLRRGVHGGADCARRGAHAARMKSLREKRGWTERLTSVAKALL